MHALIFQSQDMINLCFYFNESPPTYAYKRYAYIKKTSDFADINLNLEIGWSDLICKKLSKVIRVSKTHFSWLVLFAKTCS